MDFVHIKPAGHETVSMPEFRRGVLGIMVKEPERDASVGVPPLEEVLKSKIGLNIGSFSYEVLPNPKVSKDDAGILTFAGTG